MSETYTVRYVLDRIKENTGLDLIVKYCIRSRKGLQIWKVRGEGRQYTLKIAPEQPRLRSRIYRPHELLMQEMKMLRELSEFTSDLHVADGHTAPYHWLLTRWISGKSVTVYCSEIKRISNQPKKKRRLLDCFINLFEKVEALHILGYVHGDIQPGNFLMDETGKPHLINFTLTHKAGDMNLNYRGGLLQFNAPEVCQGLLKKASRITFDQRSEVYSLGATAFALYTSENVSGYKEESYKYIPLEKKLVRLMQGERSSFASTGAAPFPELEEVLDWCLARERSERCPAVSLALRELQERSKAFQ